VNWPARQHLQGTIGGCLLAGEMIGPVQIGMHDASFLVGLAATCGEEV